MASPTKITKAVRNWKIDKKNKNRRRSVKKLVQVRVEQLTALEKAVR